jgi:hypothetical protein
VRRRPVAVRPARRRDLPDASGPQSLAAQQRGDAQAEAAANRRLEAANREARGHATRGRAFARELGLTACVDALFAG